MSFNNFKQEFWSAHHQTAIEQDTFLATNSDFEFEGEIKQGARLKILGVARPTVNDYTGASQTAETPTDTAIYLDITQAKDTFIKVDNIDNAQSKPGIMKTLMKESAQALAEARDTFVAGLMANAVNCSASSSGNSTAEALALVDAAFTELWTNGVRQNAKLELVLAPWFYTQLKGAIVDLDTDNSDLIKSGVVGRYNGANVKISNLLYNDGTDVYMFLRTPKAVAFAGAIDQVKPTELTALGIAADAVLSVDVYGGKIVRQDELYVIKAHNS